MNRVVAFCTFWEVYQQHLSFWNYYLKVLYHYSVTMSYLTLCDPMDCSKPGFPVLHYCLEFAQIHVHWVADIIQPSHPLSPSSLPALNLSQHQGFFQWVGSLHPMDCSTLGFPVHHWLPELFQIHPSSQWCHPIISSSVVPFSFCPPIPPSIRVFSNESTLRMRCCSIKNKYYPIYMTSNYESFMKKIIRGLI